MRTAEHTAGVPRTYGGESTRWHEDYEQGRPGWPSEAVTVAVLPSASVVAELGAGTGKLTSLLAARFAHVVAVEPDSDMRRLLAARSLAVQVVAGSAEETPLADSSADAVFIAEAFHLFATAAAVGEMARLLRTGGTLVLMWNLPAGPAEPSIAAAEQLLHARGPARHEAGYDPADLNPARYDAAEWRHAFAGSRFGPFQEATMPNPQLIDRDGLVAFFASMGWIADLPDTDRAPLLDQVRALLPAPRYRRRWETRLHWTHRT